MRTQLRSLVGRRGDEGITIVELLVAFVLLGMITGLIATAFLQSVRTSSAASDRVVRSNDAQFIASFLVRDAASAGGFGADNAAVADQFGMGLSPGVKIATAAGGFCGDAGAAPLVRFEWIERSAGGVSTRTVANYGRSGDELIRRFCTQPVAAGSTASESGGAIGHYVSAASVTCVPVCGTGNVVPVPESVTLSITEIQNPDTEPTPFTFSVTGFLRTGGNGFGVSQQTAPFIALGIPSTGATCPAGAPPRTSGLGISTGGDLTVYGIAAIDSNATAAATCGVAAQMPSAGSLLATQTMVLNGGTCVNCPATVALPAPIADPYAGLTPPTYDCNSGPNTPSGNSGGTYNPGTYRTPLSITFSVSELNPGVYILCQGMAVNVSILTAGEADEGVLLYFAGGTLNIQSGIIQIHGLPSNHPTYPHMLLWQPNASTGGDVILRSGLLFNNDYDGVLYAPNSQVRMDTGLGFEEATVRSIVARNVFLGPNGQMRVGPGAQSATGLTSSPSPSNLGQTVTLTATVSAVAPASANISGSVGFYDGATQIGQANLGGANGPVRTASITVATLAGGPHTLRAVYGGSPDYASSSSATVAHIVNQATPTVALTSTPNPSGLGLNTTISATIAGVAGVPATGTVTFFDNGTQIGAPVAVAGNVAQIVTSSLTLGTHPLTATYNGDNSYLPADSNPVSHLVKLGSAISLTSSLNPSGPGQNVTFTATVTFPGAPASPAPTGTVTFYDGATPIAGSTSNVGGTVTFTTNSLTAGSHSITAQYSGDVNFLGSTSNAINQLVTSTTTTVVSYNAGSSGPSNWGTSVSFRATVTASSGTPTGTVQFRVNGANVGAPVALNVSGVATPFNQNLDPGSYVISAVYTPNNANFGASTSPGFSHTVSRGVALVEFELEDGSNPSIVGDQVRYRIHLREQPTSLPDPTGTITVTWDGAPLGAGTYTLNSGSVLLPSLSAAQLSQGSHSLAVSYAGSASFDPVSDTEIHVVNKVSSNVSFTRTSGNDPSIVGDSVTYRVNVTGGSGTPTGTVTVTLNGSPYGPGSSGTPGVYTLNGSGQYTLPSFTGATAGAYTFSATYSGNTTYNGDTDSTTHDVVKAASNVSFTRTAGNDPSFVGEAVTYRVNVTGGSGTPTGAVTVTLNGSPYGPGSSGTPGLYTLNGSGQYILPDFTGATAGTYTFSATYSGNTTYNGDTDSTTHDVVRSSTSVTLVKVPANPPSSQSGQSVTFQATITESGPGVPTGTVTYFRSIAGPDENLGTLAVGTNLTISTLPVGAQSLYAVYDGDTAFNTSTSGNLTHTVVTTYTPTIVATRTVGPNPSVLGQSVTFTATLGVPFTGLPAPTGTVTFLSGGTNLGTAPIVGTTANLAVTNLPLTGNGPTVHSITAQYNPTGASAGVYGSITSAGLSHTLVRYLLTSGSVGTTNGTADDPELVVNSPNPGGGTNFQNYAITITGTGFSAGGTTVNFSASGCGGGFNQGITATTAGFPVPPIAATFVNSTTITVNIRVASNASECLRNVIVSNPGSSGTAGNALQIDP